MRHLHVLLCLGAIVALAALADDVLGQERDLGEVIEKPVIEVYLGKTPEIRFLLWKGTGIVIARVTLDQTSDPEKLRGKIVGFSRICKDNKKTEWEFRNSPVIKKVPFNDENGVEWTLTNGQEWRIGDTFTVKKDYLITLVEAVPAYNPDGRTWWQAIGATNAVAAANEAIEIAEIAAEVAEASKSK